LFPIVPSYPLRRRSPKHHLRKQITPTTRNLPWSQIRRSEASAWALAQEIAAASWADRASASVCHSGMPSGPGSPAERPQVRATTPASPALSAWRATSHQPPDSVEVDALATVYPGVGTTRLDRMDQAVG
ncbi:MAG: hypothetical protein ABSH35_32890, partial [Isosphaeraceae bacterium]